MAIIDIIILIFVILMLILGFRKGLIISLATLIALILGIYIAIHFSNFASDLLKANFELSATYLPILSFSITFLAVLIGILLLGKLLEKLVDMVGIGFINHLAGAVLGVIKAVLILSVIFFVISMADPNEKLISPKAKNESLIYKHIASIFPTMMKWTGTEVKVPEIFN